MPRKILLVEPDYKSKYPPLGLMKLSYYHRVLKGDDVIFVKGCNSKVRDDYWDRVYISTLFTYTWKETVKTINYYRDTLFSFARKIYVGGILASLLPDKLFNETGIQPVVGLLTNSKLIGYEDNTNIDDLPPDYEILRQVPFVYDYTDAYLGYATRGCPRNCDFCAVNKFEPCYFSYIDIKRLITSVKEQFGEKQNLLLMDNNVLFSKDFDKIIDDIKTAGFTKGATYGKTKKRRFVDFNQGLDARLLTERKMRRLAEIPLEPMRLAFDDISLKDIYIRAVRMAHKYGQKDMSNYVLYNFKDSPADFYERLRINIDLNEEFGADFKSGRGVKTTIYSFPMRYIPLDATSRDVYTGNTSWNKKYLRGVQLILSVLKGPVMPGKQFFFQAFGRNIEEFKEILLMPDEFIRNRVRRNWEKIRIYENRLTPFVKKWKYYYLSSSAAEKKELLDALSSNDKRQIEASFRDTKSRKVRQLLSLHINAPEIVASEKNAS